MAFLRPPDGPAVDYEFYAPFAHMPGRYEWCRIRSPTHGVFDTFILLRPRPATVYVNAPNGEKFMHDRFPECQTIRVPPRALQIRTSANERTVWGRLTAQDGPLRSATMRLSAPVSARPRNQAYGGRGEAVWGSPRWTCWGVDLTLPAKAAGHLEWATGRRETLSDRRAVVTMGSFGRLAPQTPSRWSRRSP